MGSPDLAEVDIAVLAGGLGTRISGVLGTVPKLLAPVEGRPYLAYFLDWVAGFGARRVVLCLGHLAGAVTAWLETNPLPVPVEWTIEPEPLGTAGALRHARPLLRTDPVLVFNGDSFVDADLTALVAAHRQSGAAATLQCTRVEDASRFGRVEIDAAGFVTRFCEKGPSGPGIINAGVYVFSAAQLTALASSPARSLENDVLARLPAGSLRAVVGSHRFIDIGVPESLSEARARSLTRGDIPL